MTWPFYHPAAPKNVSSHHTMTLEKSWEEFRDTVLANVSGHLKTHVPDSGDTVAGLRKLLIKEFGRNFPKMQDTSSSVFFLRAEEFGQKTLIGNLQIDIRGSTGDWAPEHYAETLGSHGNIFHAMVQGAIKNALARGQKKIIFQAGYANVITQGRAKKVKTWGRELITPKNIYRHQRNYQKWSSQLAKLKPGALIQRPIDGESAALSDCVVLKVTPQKIYYYKENFDWLLLQVYDLALDRGFRPAITGKTAQRDLVKKVNLETFARVQANTPRGEGFADYLVNSATRKFKFERITRMTYGRKDWGHATPAQLFIREAHRQFYADAVRAYCAHDAPALLQAINKIFDYVVKVDPAAARTEKIAYLKNLMSKDREPRPRNGRRGQPNRPAVI